MPTILKVQSGVCAPSISGSDDKQAGQIVTGRWPSDLLFASGAFGDNLDKEMSRYFFCSKASQKERNAGLTIKNPHPTVKPLDVADWLATLIKPTASDGTGNAARLLVPFSGSGSEMIGGLRAGWARVTGIELKSEYVEIAKARLSYWIDSWNKSKHSGGARAGAGRKPIPILCPWCRELQPSTRLWREHFALCPDRQDGRGGSLRQSGGRA